MTTKVSRARLEAVNYAAFVTVTIISIIVVVIIQFSAATLQSGLYMPPNLNHFVLELPADPGFAGTVRESA